MSSLKRIFPIFLIVFFGYVGFSLIITIFPPMLVKQKGLLLPANVTDEVRILALGFLFACYPFGQFLSSPILGALSDRFGRRPILLYSLIISTLVYLVIVMGIWVNNYFVVVTALLVAGLSEGNVMLSQSVISDVATEEEKGHLFGYLYFTASIAFIVGPLIAGKLANPNYVSWFSYKIPFLFMSCLLFLTFVWILLGFKETHPIHQREHISVLEAFTNLKHIFKMRHLRLYFLANFLIFLGIFGFFAGFPVYAVKRFDLTANSLGIYIAWAAVPFLIINLFLFKPLFKRFTPIQLVIFSAIWLGVFLEISLIPPMEWSLWITLFLIGIGIALCLPSLSVMLARIVSKKEQGRVLGNNLSLQFFSDALVGIVIGFVGLFFLKFIVVIFGALSIIGAFLLVIARRKALH